MKTFLSKTGPWAGYVLAAISIVYTLVVGGATTQTFPGKNGAEYKVTVDIP